MAKTANYTDSTAVGCVNTALPPCLSDLKDFKHVEDNFVQPVQVAEFFRLSWGIFRQTPPTGFLVRMMMNPLDEPQVLQVHSPAKSSFRF
jgi:hypothetical protein